MQKCPKAKKVLTRLKKNAIYMLQFQFLKIFMHIMYPLAHGPWTPNEALFHHNPKLLGLSRQFGQINFGAFGVFSADLSAPILVL